MLVDTHCHLDRLELHHHNGQLASALEAARAHDVQYFLCVAITLAHCSEVLAIAETDPAIKATVGLHPNETEGEAVTEKRLYELADHPDVVAIGETGLDYYRNEGDMTWQQERFRCHIRAARALNRPVIIHSRFAPEDTINILKEERVQEVGGILHCFTGTYEMASQGLDLGLYVSFSGIITFKNAKNVQDVAAKLPLDRLLVETDAPYLAPTPYRGKPNEPAYVRYTAERLAQLHQTTYEQVAETTTANYFKLFPDAKIASSEPE